MPNSTGRIWDWIGIIVGAVVMVAVAVAFVAGVVFLASWASTLIGRL